MKNLIRLSCFSLLLSFMPGCSRENPDNYATPSSDRAVAPATETTTASEATNPDPAPAPVRRVEAPEKTSPTPPSKPTRPSASPDSNRDVPSTPATSANSGSDATEDRPANADRAPRAPAVEMQTIPAGTSLTVTMSDEVSTSSSKEGDTFHAALTDAWIVDGRVVAQRGDHVVGRVEDIVTPGKVKGRAQLTLVLTELATNDRRYKIKTEPFVAIAVDNKERDAAIIAGGAGVGAAIGAITGGKKGAAIGAILGGGGGTAAVLTTPGKSMKIEPETKVNFVLDNDVRLPVIRNRAD
jgi:hypothetical protein